MKTLLFFTLIFAFCIFGFGQNPPVPPCGLSLADSPTIQGIKLGMLKEDLDKMLSGDPTQSKTISTFSRSQLSKARGFENFQYLQASFFEDKLYLASIKYSSNAAEWKNAKEFARKLSDNLKLPFEYWRFDRENYFQSMMDCNDFTISINSNHNEITLQDKIAAAKIKIEKDAKKKVVKKQ